VPVVGLWAAVQGAHVALRYGALGRLRFANINHKRACALASAHVAAVLARQQQREGRDRGGSSSSNSNNGSSSSNKNGSSSSSSSSSSGGQAPAAAVLPLPGVDAVNRAEPMLAPASVVSPPIRFGVSFEEAWGAPVAAGATGAAEWAEAYAGEPYLLAWRGGSGARVAIKAGATPRDLLRAVWQAAWLEASSCSSSSSGIADADLETLRASLAAAREHEASFLASLAAAGWDLDQPVTLQLAPARVVVERV
jgi:hypothetical protein